MSNIQTDPIPTMPPNPPRPTRIANAPADGDTMERLFQALFYRIAVLYARAMPKHIRRLGETAILVLVSSFDLISYVYWKGRNILISFLGYHLLIVTSLLTCCIQSETSDLSFSFAKYLASTRNSSCRTFLRDSA